DVGDVQDHDRPTIVARLLHELPRAVEVWFRERIRAGVRGVGATARVDGMTGPVILWLADRPVKIRDLIHHVEQRLARLLVIEWRGQEVGTGRALALGHDGRGRAAEPVL